RSAPRTTSGMPTPSSPSTNYALPPHRPAARTSPPITCGRLMKADRFLVASVLTMLASAPGARAQTAPAAAPRPAQAEPPDDALGRSTPRGTVVSFLAAARRGENELARQYLNTTLREAPAEDLAHQL